MSEWLFIAAVMALALAAGFVASWLQDKARIKRAMREYRESTRAMEENAANRKEMH